MNGIKPLDTLYDGHYFRSRTEARWAVFFNALGIKYEYEPEGYKLEDGTCYLPDFWLPDVGGRTEDHRTGIWFEVKGIYPSETDTRKMELLCKLLGEGRTMAGIIAVGPPGNMLQKRAGARGHSDNPNELYESSWQMREYRPDLKPGPGFDDDFRLCRCTVCGKLHFDWDKWDRYDCCAWPADWAGSAGGPGWRCDQDHWDMAVSAAVEKSIKARFEHGQKG